ncbi:MAG: hypothetical protein ABL903_02735 [Methylococcales bacterium]
MSGIYSAVENLHFAVATFPRFSANDYLERDAPIADENLLLVIQSLASLHRAQVFDGVALLKKFPNRFGPHHQEDVERIWRNYTLVPDELKGIFLQA